MSRYKGGIIRSTPITTSRFGVNSGMFSLGQQLQANQGKAWPTDYDVVLQFTDSGSWECPPGVTEISEYLIIAGGGAGGGVIGGGGGAGGFKTGTGFSVTPGQTYTITVGGGGSSVTSDNYGGNGVGSSIQGGSPIIHLGSNGGGGGGSGPGGLSPGPANAKGRAGGSGGGNGHGGSAASDLLGQSVTLTSANGHGSFPSITQNSPFPLQGKNGSLGAATGDPKGSAGGGGGADEIGENAVTGTPSGGYYGGNGGNGLVSSITGTSQAYAGGGGGASYSLSYENGRGGLNPTSDGLTMIGGNGSVSASSLPNPDSTRDAVVSTGSGGGGGSTPLCNGPVSGQGASGIVIIKYKNKPSNNLFKFTGSGIWKNEFNAKTIDYLVVAGGGGGSNYYGGGGGAGGTRIGTLDVSNRTDGFTITVGGGGHFGNLPNPGPWLGGNGSGSSLQYGSGFRIASNGGGGGGRYDGDPDLGVQMRSAGHPGGCGGGFGFQVGSPGFPGGPDGTGTNTFGRTLLLDSSNGHSYPLSVTGENTFRGTAIQGSDGGVGFHAPGHYAMSGGGGGATQRGGNGFYSTPGLQGGNGGDGIVFNGEFFAGGGGGICNDKSGVADPGNSPYNYVPQKGIGGNGGGGNSAFYPGVNFSESGSNGTGGGGGGAQQQDPSVAGAGGSGIVIIKITG